MKKLVILMLVMQATLTVGCSKTPNPASAGFVSTPGSAVGGALTDPNAAYDQGAAYGDPNAAYGQGDAYGDPNAGYDQGGAYGDPNAGYGQQPGGAYGDPNAGYGQQPGGAYGDPNAGYGQPGAVDPVTGQPLNAGINPQLDPGVSQRVVSAIQGAGGYKALKADNKAIEAMKSMGMPISQAFQHAPLEHRALIIKALLDGWAGTDEKNYARQIWATILPQDQQRVMGQDPELSKLVTKKILGSSSSGGTTKSILSSLGRLVGLG